MARSTVHYADTTTNNLLKRLHNKLRPAGTPVQRVEYIIELLLLRIFEVKLKQDPEFDALRKIFRDENEDLLFSNLSSVPNEQILPTLNSRFFPFYARILSEARKVISGNPNIKVQDQLVLIEEVFSNSNFSNNVQSGNLSEIIGYVGGIDEDRLLKTDLLGDAIESALSETGGTKDIGLHRTPDHIRHFMVGLCAPTFADRIFDPTAGTGGFLFDGFEFVMEAVRRDDSWPGTKAHPELDAWFKKWFHEHPVAMPSFEASTDFYRQGVTGIEYLGMIRKMAAINFYIRGLNPGNIMQGDALAMFKKQFLPERATVILANPPFGAQRDQEAYPDVWAEYPKESETTILFVKLMLEALKPGGRCAVIVSEGFMTWDQNSARALRKALLDEADLRAIISLPQGVFVSKNGQGPKTSILYFEKPPKGAPIGHVTHNVWFYKVTNDGYTMGSNRKTISGCQLVEALDLFHKYVRQNKVSPETRHSFTVPAAWIRTLDPRIKERIRTETKAEITAKADEDRAKLFATLEARVAAGKLTTADMNDRLAQHEQLWSNKLINEIAKRIDRAHLFSWNLPNYRSSLSQEQRDAWIRYSADRVSENEESLDSWWQRIQTAKAEELPELLSRLDPANTLELELARQRLTSIDSAEFKKDTRLQLLMELLATSAKYPRAKIKDLVEPVFDRVKKDEYDGTVPIVEKISFSDGKIHFRELRETGMDLYRAASGDLVTSKINVHQGATAIAPCDLVTSTHYQIHRIHADELNPKYLISLLRSPQFLSSLIEQKNNGIKNEQGAEFYLEFEIPLPSPEEQDRLVAEIDRLQSVINGVELLLVNMSIPVNEFTNFQPLGNAVLDTRNGWSPRCDGGETLVLSLSCLKNGGIDLSQVKFTNEVRPDIKKFYVQEGDFFYSRGNTPELVALAGIAKNVESKIVFPDLLTRVRFDENLILPEYAAWLFNSKIGRNYFGSVPVGASPSMVKVSQDYMAAFKVPCMGDISMQRKIVDRYSQHQNLIEQLKAISIESSNAITSSITMIWEH